MATVADVSGETGRGVDEVLETCRELGIVASSGNSGLSAAEHTELRAALGASVDLPPVEGGSRSFQPSAEPVADQRSLLDRHAALTDGLTEGTRPRQRWSARLIMRIAIGTFLLAAVAVGVVSLVDRSDDPVSVLGYTTEDEGTCHDVDEAGEGPLLTEAACDEPHDVELIGVIAVDEERLDSTAPGGAFPGTVVLADQAEDACGERFVSLMGEPLSASELSVAFLVPTSETWEAGDRAILCLAEDPDGQLTEPLDELGR